MERFIRRFVGALALDPATFENIEADRSAWLQSLIVVALVAAAGGVAAIGLGLAGISGFIAGALIVFGAWLVWIVLISLIGTTMFREAQTQSGIFELIRTLGFATAPGVLIGLAAIRWAAPVVLLVVSFWVIADAVVAMRQALDYRSTTRAAVVCVVAWVVSVAIFAIVAEMFTPSVPLVRIADYFAAPG